MQRLVWSSSSARWRQQGGAAGAAAAAAGGTAAALMAVGQGSAQRAPRPPPCRALAPPAAAHRSSRAAGAAAAVGAGGSSSCCTGASSRAAATDAAAAAALTRVAQDQPRLVQHLTQLICVGPQRALPREHHPRQARHRLVLYRWGRGTGGGSRLQHVGGEHGRACSGAGGSSTMLAAAYLAGHPHEQHGGRKRQRHGMLAGSATGIQTKKIIHCPPEASTLKNWKAW